MNSRNNIKTHLYLQKWIDLVGFYLLYGFWMFLALDTYSTM